VNARRHPGIKTRHQSRCATQSGASCDCSPSYQAVAYDRSTGKKIYSRRFSGKHALKAAIQWRRITLGNLEAGRNVVVSRKTLNEVAAEFIAGAGATPPTTLTRSGKVYKPSVLRDYKSDLTQRVLPDLGARRASDIRRGDVQRLVDRMVGEGLSGSRVRNIVNSLRAVYRFANDREETDNNPCQSLRLPNGAGKRERVLSVAEGEELLSVIPEKDRAQWAVGLYGGLRAGEMMALRWEDVDLDASVIRVRRGWDELEGEITPKSVSGVRDVPVVHALRRHLLAAQLACAWSSQPDGLVFGRSQRTPFVPSTVARRARRAWDTENARRTKLDEQDGGKRARLVPVTLHEMRHCYVSLMAHAGVPIGTVSKWAGHADIKTTMNVYAKVMPEAATEAVALVNAYLANGVGPTG
jgi:integrase